MREHVVYVQPWVSEFDATRAVVQGLTTANQDSGSSFARSFRTLYSTAFTSTTSTQSSARDATQNKQKTNTAYSKRRHRHVLQLVWSAEVGLCVVVVHYCNWRIVALLCCISRVYGLISLHGCCITLPQCIVLMMNESLLLNLGYFLKFLVSRKSHSSSHVAKRM